MEIKLKLDNDNNNIIISGYLYRGTELLDSFIIETKYIDTDISTAVSSAIRAMTEAKWILVDGLLSLIELQHNEIVSLINKLKTN